jgi:hypothetical protein
MVTITKTLEGAVVAPSPRWPPGTRMSGGEKAAIEAWCREAQSAITALMLAVKELQIELKDLDERAL